MMRRIQPYGSLVLFILLTAGLLIGCGPKVAMEKRANTIAIWDLDNLNPDKLNDFNLGELLAAKVMASFERSGQWVLVEREALILALEEQNVGSTAAVSEETRLRIGKLLGANYMMFGNYMVFMQTLQLNLRIVDVQTGRVIKAAQKTAPFKTVGDALETIGPVAKELLEQGS